MLKKYGKFYARWTDAQGNRHVKACKTKRAAAKLQREKCRERETKKAQPKPRSAPSRQSGRKRHRGQTHAPSPKTSAAHSGTSPHSS